MQLSLRNTFVVPPYDPSFPWTPLHDFSFTEEMASVLLGHDRSLSLIVIRLFLELGFSPDPPASPRQPPRGSRAGTDTDASFSVGTLSVEILSLGSFDPAVIAVSPVQHVP